jgi:hypothetical protein
MDLGIFCLFAFSVLLGICWVIEYVKDVIHGTW